MDIFRRAGLAALAALAVAQPAGAQVRLAVQWLYPIETLYFADLSPYTVGSQPDFLSIQLLSGAAQQSVRLEVVLLQERPRAERIFEGTTDPFPIPGTGLRLTNRDLACETCPYGIEDAEIASAFEDLLTETGRFPAGSYVVGVRALTSQGLELDRAEVRIELVNPSRLELLSPGRPFGETPEVLANPTPRFLWSSDAGVVSGGGEYRLRVVPVDGAASAEDAIQGFAAWEATLAAPSALYPGSASALPLRAGGTYAWQVVREVRSSSGTERIASPVYWFRMADVPGGPSDPGNAGDVASATVFAEIVQALNLSGIEGFRPSGTLLVNGQPVPADRLEELLRAILGGQITLTSITVR